MFYWARIFWITVKRLVQEKYTYRASALAFTTLLALIPLLSVIISFLTLFPFFKQFTDLTRTYIMHNFMPSSGNIIQHYLEGFIEQTTHLSIIGIGFLFVTAVLMILTVESTFNEIWNVSKRNPNIKTILLYWLILLCTPLFIGITSIISSYLFSISWFNSVTATLGVTAYLLACLPVLINTAIFATLYLVVPNHTVKIRYGIAGGFVAAILFEIANKIFALYLLYFPTYELIYGVLATIPIFLVWIYISWLILLFGALFTHAQYHRPR